MTVMASLMETEDKVHVVSMMGDAGFGSDGANEDNREEEALREMVSRNFMAFAFFSNSFFSHYGQRGECTMEICSTGNLVG